MITHEKKYYKLTSSNGEGTFVKRSLVPSEYMTNLKGKLVVAVMPMARLKNEVAAINFVKQHTNIPVPNIRCAFEDNGRYYIITDIVPGKRLVDLREDEKPKVIDELEGYLETMHGMQSTSMGGFAGVACLPYRVAMAVRKAGMEDEAMEFRNAGTHEFILCHNDLSQANVIVDEETHKINAIIDWEYAGFYPKEFDGAFYKRPGISMALEGNDGEPGEPDDVPALMKIIRECVVPKDGGGL